MKRVFILQQPRRNDLDLSSLSEFGEVIELIKDDEHRPPLFTPDFGNMIIERLEQNKFDPKEDYFAIVGSIATMCIAVGALIHVYGHVTALVYQSAQCAYVSLEIGDTVYV